MNSGLSITGRKKRSDDFDFYETPKWAVEKVLEAMLMDGIINKYDDIYEPCVGAGAISDVLRTYKFLNLRCSDIQNENYIKGEKGVDVYELSDGICDVVITNPPYNLMTLKEKDGGSMLNEFLRIANKKVILLLNVFFLSSKERKKLLESSHLRHMYIHSDRVTMYPYGEEKPKNGGTKMYVWIVWDKEFDGKPTFSWIQKGNDNINSKSPAGMSVHSNRTDWNTPVKYVDLVHKMFNKVEFDPCSNVDSIINAEKEIMLPNDGLKCEWNYKTIFVNPPYGRDFERKSTIKNWIAKCYESNKKYNSEILLLIPVATNTSHWKEFVFEKASAICFLYDTRLKFRINGNEDNKGCPTACAMIYYGANVEKFYKIFSSVGYVMSK